ncbi:MAG: Ppx/GppA phosphatase family protein [Dissulfurimicrobium sp.]|uniref:Ppx/GppA phosphatase family protein n=1 Tax=Dissulfurimicrobium TaxID=1769732 RepID=UPI003C729DB1
MKKTIAVLDIGSQTFRMAIVDVEAGGIKIRCSERVNVRLGQGLSAAPRLSVSGIKNGVAALKRFRNLLTGYDIDRVVAYGTAALRKAENASVFIDMAKNAGFDIEILAGNEEARLSAMGVYYSLKGISNRMSLIADVGGGSTELILARGGEILFSRSLDIGAVGLSEKFFGTGVLSGEEFERLGRFVARSIHDAKRDIGHTVPEILIGTGGSATAAGAMFIKMARYEPSRIRGLVLSADGLSDLLSCLIKAKTPLEKNTILGLEPERADILPAGIAIFLSVLSTFNLKDMIITDGGLLLGLLINLVQKELGIHVEPSYTSGLYI